MSRVLNERTRNQGINPYVLVRFGTALITFFVTPLAIPVIGSQNQSKIYALGGNHMNTADKMIVSKYPELYASTLSAFIDHRPCSLYTLPVRMVPSHNH